MISSYKNKSDEHMECEEDNDENDNLKNGMELYKSQQNMEVCKSRLNDCVRDRDACTQQLKEKKIEHEKCLNDKENMHSKCFEYQIKLTKYESNLRHTINALGRCEKKLEKTWF